jgi:hypothetical protein
VSGLRSRAQGPHAFTHRSGARGPRAATRAGLALATVATGSLVLAQLSGCDAKLPGQLVGAYTIQMRIKENNCGSGVVPNAQSYAAELRAGDPPPRGFWRVPKQAPIEGQYEAGKFQFTFSMGLELGQADAGTTGCTAIREELLQGEIALPEPDAGASDAGSPDAGVAAETRDAGPNQPALMGTHRISFRTDPAGRCANNPGPIAVFERLPCSALYELPQQRVVVASMSSPPQGRRRRDPVLMKA